MITKSKEVGTAEATWLCPKPLALQLPRIGREASSSSEPATWFSSWFGPKVPDLLFRVQMPCLWMCSNTCTGLQDTRREKGYCSSPPQPSSTSRCGHLATPQMMLPASWAASCQEQSLQAAIARHTYDLCLLAHIAHSLPVPELPLHLKIHLGPRNFSQTL